MVREQNVVVKEGKYFLGNLIGSSVPSRRNTVQHRPVGQFDGYKAGQTLSFKLPQSGYLDVQSSYIKFRLNLSANGGDIGFLSSHALVKRLIVKDGQNNILEDIDNYNQLFMLTRRAMACYDQYGAKEMLYGSGDEEKSSVANGTTTGMNSASVDGKYLIITLDLSGIFGSNIKYLPLEHIENGMFLDIQLARDKDVIIDDEATATTYTLNDVAFVCDVVEFTPEFENQFKEYLQQMPLELYYHSYTNHLGNISNGSLGSSITVSEKASSVKDVYFVIVPDANLSTAQAGRKLNSYTYTPLSGNLSVSLQLGNQRIPQYPMSSQVECLAELRKSFNVLNDQVMGGLISRSIYEGTSTTLASSFIMGLNLENHLASSVDGTLVMSGKDSKSVSQNMVLNLTNGSAFGASQTVYIFTHTDRIYSVDSFGKGVVSY